MARLKVSRGVEANVLKLNANKTAVDGTLYFATDTGKMWMGTSDGTLLQIKDGIDTTYSSLKNPYSLTIQGNGTTLSNGTYDGSSAKTVNITPSSIGAAASSHNHDASNITSGTLAVARGGTGQTNLDNVTVGTAKTLTNTGGRVASANVLHGNGKVYYYLATSSMTEGKPTEDGHILHLSWDNNGGWDSQISQNDTDGGLQVRAENGGTWSKWVRVYDENHKPTASAIGAAASSHSHSASDITSGSLSVARGGTGASDAATARTNLGITPANIGAAAAGNYAGSGSLGGAANSAVKLTTARTIDGVSFDGSANITHYGTCSIAAGTAAKTVALTGFTLSTGATVIVKFTNANTIASPTLNVNGTGAKPIWINGAAMTASNGWAAGACVMFVYDGTQYQAITPCGPISTSTIDTTCV